MKHIYLPAVLVAGLMTTGSSACEFHSGMFGGGAYGTEWRTYSSDELDALLESTYNSKSEQSDAEAKRKARPVFSSSAARAVQSAKTTRSQNSDAKAKSKAAEDTTGTN